MIYLVTNLINKNKMKKISKIFKLFFNNNAKLNQMININKYKTQKISLYSNNQLFLHNKMSLKLCKNLITT